MPSEPEKVKVSSPDLVEERRSAFDGLFPGVIADGVLDVGRLSELLDISPSVVPNGRERFGLMWAGKNDSVRSLLRPSRATLVPDFDRSTDFDTAENMFIEGDNLEVLKILQKAYNDKIKLIYIDPPYNTGNDFVYRDDFSDGLRAYLDYSGQIDEEGNRTNAIADTAGRRHSGWLSMMFPRLMLARNLLTQDGIIFVSIDDNEVANLRLLMDEIFGPENFVATFIWEKRTNRENRKAVSYRHDTLLCYTRSRSDEAPIAQLPMSDKALANYSNPDNDPRGPWKSDPATAQAGHATTSQFYELLAPNGRVHTLPSGRCWAYTKPVMNEAIRDGRIWFGKDGNGVPRIKTYLNAKERGLTPETILFAEQAATNERAKNDLKELFGGLAVFDTPKPVELIRLLLQMGASRDGLVLDFFAGSGTTAHAVALQNAEDGGRRRVISINLPEPTPPDSEAARAGYGTISAIAQARLDLIMNSIDGARRQGLRSFRLAESNFRSAGLDTENLLEIDLRETTLVSDEPYVDDLAAEIFLKEGVALDTPWERHTAGEADVIIADGIAVVTSLDITDSIVTESLALSPRVVVFLEDGFAGSDAVKANAFSHARNLGITMKTV
jgi:adenine-specific DNA-methyltransferase